MRYADCHPDRKHYVRGQCKNCDYNERYHARRALGMPSWQARGVRIREWVEHYQKVKEWRYRNPEKTKAQYRRKYQKRKALYGDGALKTLQSRVKWLEAKGDRAVTVGELSRQGTGHD